jgi:hypothetical protein
VRDQLTAVLVKKERGKNEKIVFMAISYPVDFKNVRG